MSFSQPRGSAAAQVAPRAENTTSGPTAGPATTAQSSAPPPATPQAEASPANAPPQPGWIARCSSLGRDAPLECAIEEMAVLTKTGQVIVAVNIRVAGDTDSPVAVVQLPARAEPAGRHGARTAAATPTRRVAGTLAALKSGKQLKVSSQTLSKEPVTIPMPLADFAAAYDRIK